MKRLLGSVLVALLTVLAMSNLAMACRWIWYQPEVPPSLLK